MSTVAPARPWTVRAALSLIGLEMVWLTIGVLWVVFSNPKSWLLSLSVPFAGLLFYALFAGHNWARFVVVVFSWLAVPKLLLATVLASGIPMPMLPPVKAMNAKDWLELCGAWALALAPILLLGSRSSRDWYAKADR